MKSLDHHVLWDSIEKDVQYHLDLSLRQALCLYVDTLFLWNQRYSFVAQKSRDDLILFHVRDALLAYRALSSFPGDIWADVGTGVGLPGLILALVFPNKQFWLVDRSRRKMTFLRLLVHRLGLQSRVVLFEGLIENLEQKSFDLILSRALGNTLIWAPRLKRLLNHQGRLVFYKGQYEKTQKMLEELKGFFSHAECVLLESSSQTDKAQRCLLVLHDVL